MIIFDLDTLADDTHRLHWIDQYTEENKNIVEFKGDPNEPTEILRMIPRSFYKGTDKRWRPNYEAYNAACVNDVPIEAVANIFRHHMTSFTEEDRINNNCIGWQIWSTRCESTIEHTHKWLIENISSYLDLNKYKCRLKMRPIGNIEPAHVLKERWLETRWPELVTVSDTTGEMAYEAKDSIDYVFDSDPESIAMFRRRGIFVFDCRQV